MMEPADQAARLRALTDLSCTLLVEAAAGTGKTALIAGRLTMLLASGVAPSRIAAITFTEAAASELSARVHRYVERLLQDQIPSPLKAALPEGLSSAQREHLRAAHGKLEELTTSTIHGFCQTLILSYAVEADIDPGAQILDATQMAAVFDTVFNRWLRQRLGKDGVSQDPLVVLSKEDPHHVVMRLRELALFSLRHRAARAIAADLSGRPDIDLVEAVQVMRAWHAATPGERLTDALIASLEMLAEFFRDSFESPPDFERLWRLAHPQRVAAMKSKSFELQRPRLKQAWQKAAKGSDAERFHDELITHFTQVDGCYRVLLGKVATALVASLTGQLEEVLRDYARYKRSAALLDFDDLLYTARLLVRSHEPVRRALGGRYTHILVDEFQDTDPIQCEILFRIAGVDRPERWESTQLREGALFLVGDPKQAIFGFRGADIETYERARNAIRKDPNRVLHITSSFRSRAPILNHVNRCFEGSLSAPGQPGYVALVPTRENDVAQSPVCVAKKTIELPSDPNIAEIREAEARAVAEVCARLIGNIEIGEEDKSRRLLTPADIALLTPAGTDLLRYEHALDDLGLSHASQAGKNLFDRQEIQDLVSLARALADPADTLALGALLRGPLVGLTEEELLDVTAELPPVAGRSELPAYLSLRTDPAGISHPRVREILMLLQDLRRRAGSTTPLLLMSEAVERLHVRALLGLREAQRAGRALANVDVFLELARAYDARGLKQFVRDVNRRWGRHELKDEGRIDALGDAIEIVTIHSSKGREWPVVILINTVSEFRPRDAFVHRPSDATLHWVIGDVVPPDLHAALERDDERTARERERLMYVAFTRARDLLILPKIPKRGAKSWTDVMSDPYQDLPELEVDQLPATQVPSRPEARNEQTAEVFEEQRRRIRQALRRISWLRPSLDDLDQMPMSELVVNDAEEGVEAPAAIGAGRQRGLVLHKMMEEVLTGELAEDAETLNRRAEALLAELPDEGIRRRSGPDPEELGGTIRRTLALPDIAALRSGLVPEFAVFATLTDPEVRSLAGRADAVFVREGVPEIVLDWKSDVEPSDADFAVHAAQLRVYLRAMGLNRGALVYLSIGRTHWIELKARSS